MTYPPPPQRVRTSSTSPFVVDAIIAALLVFTLGPMSLVIGVSMGNAVGAVVAALTSLGMPAALAWRRTRPVGSSVAVYAMALAHVLAGVILTGSDLVIFVALYSVTVYGPVWARRTALGSALLGCLIVGGWYLATAGTWSDLRGVVSALTIAGLLGALVIASWAVGLMRRARVVQIETLAERAARLEVERDQQAQIATAAERARIAREMHDIVAHSLSVIIAQADGGRYAAATSPEAATHALSTISETGRDALADMRRILGVLRDDGRGDAALAPQPAQADLDTLVAHVRDAGLEISLVRMGTPRALPPGAGLTIYRIAQESLTNILKHAGPGASATVLVQWTPASLVLQVDDDGRGAAASSDGAGHGLLGMRERATMLGGTLAAGPRTGGGYRVRAEIPVPAGGPEMQAQPLRPPNTVGPGGPGGPPTTPHAATGPPTAQPPAADTSPSTAPGPPPGWQTEPAPPPTDTEHEDQQRP